MIPKIDFKYSYIYDELFRNSIDLNKILQKTGKKYPSAMETISFMNELEMVWKKEGGKILEKISEISGLDWKIKNISCYIVGTCRPMSDPLTIKKCNDITHAVDILTHELIHNLQSQINEKKWEKWQKYIDKKYARESSTTRDHILLNAIHMALYLDYFGADRLMRDMWNSNVSTDYKRSWEIVENEGPDKIVRKFRQLTR
jgi:hypothetical protein